MEFEWRRIESRLGGPVARRAIGLSLLLASASVVGVIARQQEDVLPKAPLSLTATVNGTLVSLQWSANPAGAAAESYQVHAGTTPGASNVAIVTLRAAVTALDATAPPGTYYVRVVAVNRFGVSQPSNEVVVTVRGDCLLPGVPTGLNATTGPGTVTLSWLAGPGSTATGHGLLVGSSPGTANIGTFSIGPATSLVASAPNGTYFVRVFAFNGCGQSSPSVEISFTVGAPALVLPAGIYDGQVFNHTRPSPGRPPITSFVLQLNQPVAFTNTLQVLSAVWTDNAGCRQTVNILAANTQLGPSISMEQLACNDGGRDFALFIRPLGGSQYDGTCPLGGPTCTFRMTRR